MEKKIGILGGTFDPPHIGHLIIANECLSQASLDEIWFMPNNVPPHKHKTDHVTNEEREQMVRLAIQDHPQFKLETIELHREGKSYTVDTMRQLVNQNPGLAFYFIIGGDMIEYLPNWYKVDELVQMVQFLGVKRPYYQHQSKYPVQMLDVPEIYLSSTQIRDRIQKGQSIRYLVPDCVKEYIEENGIYGT
ncbi:nicotinate-nucleotide adenylyltransferase [Bacillus oleivorans]|uniref:Probable nicotinate-nucleotide adenylyltransferase n=1 Tax=Bacillus oleivorans TaxID=1448271 RepID=A0A285CJR6_9BACI|nr:nicotinate-nucleotide adenylyltransferase [Bacillus oleivorans]SNX67841.1 nicotinate-nucleotide adenylyltransferase [Bacillus oleivorans]